MCIYGVNFCMSVRLRELFSHMVTQVMFDHDLDPNIKGAGGITLLHVGAMCSKPASVRCLLANGADPKVQDVNGGTPLSMAKDDSIKKMLVDAQEGKVPDKEEYAIGEQVNWIEILCVCVCLLFLTRTHILFLSLSLSLSLSLTHTHTHTLSLARSLSHPLILTHSYTHTHAHTHSFFFRIRR